MVSSQNCMATSSTGPFSSVTVTEYIAPADGYVYANGGNLNGCASSSVRYYDNFLPVRRGGTFILTYANGTPSSFRFFYANGAV